MTTKGLMNDAKADVCAWLSKAVFLHESLPDLTEQHLGEASAPELLGGPGSTCASSTFLMSVSALLLHLGVGCFSCADEKVRAV